MAYIETCLFMIFKCWW